VEYRRIISTAFLIRSLPPRLMGEELDWVFGYVME